MKYTLAFEFGYDHDTGSSWIPEMEEYRDTQWAGLEVENWEFEAESTADAAEQACMRAILTGAPSVFVRPIARYKFNYDSEETCAQLNKTQARLLIRKLKKDGWLK